MTFFKKNPNRISRSLLVVSLLCAHTATLRAQEKVWSLKDCLTQAWQQNVALNQRKLDNEVNRINYEQARENALPSLNLSDAQNFNYGKYYTAGGQQYTNQDFSMNSLSLNTNVVLFNGLQYHALVKENKFYYESGVMDVERAKNELGLNVVAAYMQVLYSYEAVAIAQSQIEGTKEQMERTKKYVAVGQLPELNLLQIQAQMATDIATKVNAENQLQLAKVSLMQLMEIPVSNDFEVAKEELKEISPNISMTAAEIYEAAVNSLPEVRGAAARTTAAAYATKAARAIYLPKLTLSGNLSTSYSSINNKYVTQTSVETQNIGYLQNDPSEKVMGPVPVNNTTKSDYPFFDQYKDNFGQAFGLNLSIPIFNNLSSRNNVSKARVAERNAQLNEQAVKNQLRKSIEQAYTDQVAAGKNYLAAAEQLNAEQRAYKNMELKFMQGAANATDFIVEKSNYNKSMLMALQAKYQYVFKGRIVNFYITSSLMP